MDRHCSATDKKILLQSNHIRIIQSSEQMDPFIEPPILSNKCPTSPSIFFQSPVKRGDVETQMDYFISPPRRIRSRPDFIAPDNPVTIKQSSRSERHPETPLELTSQKKSIPHGQRILHGQRITIPALEITEDLRTCLLCSLEII
jgi:hypothetical protein